MHTYTYGLQSNAENKLLAEHVAPNESTGENYNCQLRKGIIIIGYERAPSAAAFKILL